MDKMIKLLKGEISSIKLKDGRELSLITSRDTEDDTKTGFYLNRKTADGEYITERISNQLGYALVAGL